ncbi:MAG: hypothetical protein N3F05_04735, partial [Candidatus Diapherotrites archaeon]|nr:hypothetical protein [Candidatus Diapherotrites archaeon]
MENIGYRKIYIFLFMAIMLSIFCGPISSQSISDSVKGYTELSLVFISSYCVLDQNCYKMCVQKIGSTIKCRAQCSQTREEFSPVVKEYESKILDYFRFPSQKKVYIESMYFDDNDFLNAARVVVGMEVALGGADSGYRINFIKNDVSTEKAPNPLTLDYGIAIEPPTGEDQPQPGKEPQPRKNEWINEGGEADSPPMINVSKEFISKLCDKGQKRYWHSVYFARYYPLPLIRVRLYDMSKGSRIISDKYCKKIDNKGYISYFNINKCAKEDYNKFETEVEKISTIPNIYTARNGYEAYVIPLDGLKTQAYGGVQLFRAVDASIRCFISCNGRLDENIDSNKINVYEIPFYRKVVDGKERFYLDLDQAAEKCKNVQRAEPYIGCYDVGSAYFAYVDKIFFPDTMESVQADWLIRLYKPLPKEIVKAYYNGSISELPLENPKLIFQVPLQLASGTPPEISFEYQLVAITGEEVLVSFKPKASDSDGRVESITWDFGNGKQYVAKPNEEVTYSFAPGYYSVSALAYDNEGLKSKKVRTLNLSLETSKPLFSVTIPELPPELPPTMP